MTTQKKHIILVPYGGLGNRMKAVAAGIRIARQYNYNIDIYWFQDKGLASRFDHLFLPIDIPGVRIIEAPKSNAYRYNRPRRPNFYLSRCWLWLQGYRLFVDIKDINKLEAYLSRHNEARVWISSCYYFIDEKNIPVDAYDIFKPLPSIQADVDAVAANFGDNTVGIHVRRTDNQSSKDNSKTEDFIECMELLPADTRFYLATDESYIKQLFTRLFGSRITTMAADACRNTNSGIRDAVIEMFVLSRTKRIFGSHGSTFSVASACIGRKPYQNTDIHTADTLTPAAPLAKKILVIIVSYNFTPWIDRCLGSLEKSETPVDVMVIDNKSTDGTPEIVEQRYPHVTVIRNNQNLGFGRANNIGMQYAIDNNYDAVLLLNQDAWIESTAIGRLAEASRRHPRYGILSPVHLTGSGDNIEYGFSVYTGVKSKDTQPDAQLVQVPFINAAIWYMPVEALKQVGLFAKIYQHYGEDKDMANRMAYHNYRIGFLPRVYGCHDREHRKVTPQAFHRAELVYHLSELTNPGNPLFRVTVRTVIEIAWKLTKAILTLNWQKIKCYFSVSGQLVQNASAIRLTREQSDKVNINNYK